MPRGNDAKAAAAEFRGQYGMMGNAEDLIEANRAAFPSDLRSANLLGRDSDYDHDEHVEDLRGKIEGGKVLDSAKHGDYIVAVVETESGHVYKQVVLAHDVGVGPEPQQTDSESDEAKKQAALDRQAEADQEARLIIANARLEADRIVQEAVEKAQVEASEKAQAARDEANQVQQQAAEDLQSETGDAGPGATTPAGGQEGSEGSTPSTPSGEGQPAERQARRRRES